MKEYCTDCQNIGITCEPNPEATHLEIKIDASKWLKDPYQIAMKLTDCQKLEVLQRENEELSEIYANLRGFFGG